MSHDTNTLNKKTAKDGGNPWAWVPTLYVAEGLPYVLVMTVSTIMYTRLGASLSAIGLWTSLLGFAWVIKPLWGPLVDQYWTKRRWSVLMQILMGVLLGVVAVTLQGPFWWSGSLLALAMIALFSATHDIAADGFYMDALSEKRQSFFVGIRSTFYRLAMIFGQGVLLIIVGAMEQRTGPDPVELVINAQPPGVTAPAPAPVADSSGFVIFDPPVQDLDAGSTVTVNVRLAEQPETTRTVALTRESSSFWSTLFPFGAEQQVSLADRKYEALQFGADNWDQPQEVVFSADGNMRESIAVKFKATSGNIPLSWGLCFGGVGLLLASLGVFHLFALPKPRLDGANQTPTTPFSHALMAMVGVVAVPVAIYAASYYVIFAGLSLVLPFSAPLIKMLTILTTLLLFWLLLLERDLREKTANSFSRAATYSGVPFDKVFSSFFAKPGIKPMLAFLLLYRLGEALLVKMSGPFLVMPASEGGIGLTSAQYGLAYGTFGIVTLTLGGILGGLVASRQGLRKWLWPMCLAINLPDALYVYLAVVQPEEFWKVLVCVAGETFGYGFGFTAYMLYMLYIASTGEPEHKTSHFALCTGFMALGMMLPGMISGDLAEWLGWPMFFIVVCIATIPGFAILSFIPLDKDFGRRSDATE